MNEIFRLLDEQRELLERVPFSTELVRKDKEISTRIRQLVDQICVEQSTERAKLDVVRFKELLPSSGKTNFFG